MNELAKKERFEVEYGIGTATVKLNPTIVRKYLVNGRAELVTETEIVMFMQMCRFQGLNPFLREAFLIKYSSNDPATIVTGKDTFTKRAASIPECAGYNAGVIVRRKKGAEQETIKRVGAVVYDGEELVGGWGRAFRKGWQEAVEIEVSLKEYMRYSAKGEPTRSWKQMPATMVRKVALVQALREAFPDRYSSMYSPEEMPIDDSRLPTAPVQLPEGETVMHRQETEGEPPEPEDDTPPEVAEGASRAFDEADTLPSADSDAEPGLF